MYIHHYHYDSRLDVLEAYCLLCCLYDLDVHKSLQVEWTSAVKFKYYLCNSIQQVMLC